MRNGKNRADKALTGMFMVSLAIYLVIFAAAFAALPIRIPPWHQFLLLTFHFIPMFALQLLLCMRAGLLWRLLIPPALLAVPGVVFLSLAEWAVMGWVLFLLWCIAPALGCVLAWLVWAIRRGGRREP